ncbi:probable basic-leucine zipper transcription factor Q [Anopheles aquasalis]|uniref:probable basic-leucine zipper transcription factor Q n=1 Tax=Anopheles aquasalis TaxID=42839 RepID=UPI00215B0408|nr:probable basic-leucine zipper transcription factor Q [Anopheles aquasalis]XP_050087191.1 probable basic-leucine zipper transcription factor Q [Anopheles aquasalis]XP_050087199.1 probable basic-leucine zipper transcription factor Q [Anopheles aquasalis]XP_050087207.1 probable basic-leucine zipper transcription factor Q [Anopheles aquasalis]
MYRPHLHPTETIRAKMRVFEADATGTGGGSLDDSDLGRRNSWQQQREQQQREQRRASADSGSSVGSRQQHHHQQQQQQQEGDSTPLPGMMPPINANQSVMTDSQGLILPKKLVNPVLESMDRQNLHRELMFNQKIGKSVLNQKSELQRALEKQKERQVLAAQNLAKHQHQQQQTEQTIANELGRVIMQRAQRLEQQKAGSGGPGTDQTSGSINPEYLNARAKLRATVDTK